MSELRAKLVRLAHANPALRADLLPLLKSASSGPTDEAGALKALQVLVVKASLPIRVTNAAQEVYPVQVPKGFSSLFSLLRIDVDWRNETSASVSWKYQHPRGSNGYSIGWVMFDEKAGKWGWRLDEGGYGYVM
jgi:hypothetical protein